MKKILFSGTFRAILILSAVNLFSAAAMSLTEEQKTPPTVAAINLDGPVDPASQEYLVRAIGVANENGNDLILIRVNTPGGMVDSMEDISRSILGSSVPVAVWVGPHGARAASAGFILLMTSDIAAMSQGTRTGAAHPIMAIGGLFPIGDQQTSAPEPSEPGDSKLDTDDGKDGKRKSPSPSSAMPNPTSSVLMDKIGNDMKAFVRSITKGRDRNPEQAVQAVSVSRSWSESEALEANLIEIIASDENDLFNQIDGRPFKRINGELTTLSLKDATMVEIEMTTREKMLTHVVNPNVAFILLLFGILLVYIEITHFGLIVPGVTGLACLAVAVSGLSLLPLNASGVLMIIAGIGLLVAEAFVTSFGMLAVLGVITMAIGGIILVDVPRIEGVGLDPVIAISAAIGFGLIVLLLTRLVIRALRSKPATGPEGFIDETGVAVNSFETEGNISVHGEYWKARCAQPISKGERVVVTAVDGLVLTVKPVNETEE